MCIHAGPTLVLSARFVSAGNGPLKLNFTYHSCFPSINPILLAYFVIFSKTSMRGRVVFGKSFHWIPSHRISTHSIPGWAWEERKTFLHSAFDRGDAQREAVSKSTALPFSLSSPSDKGIELFDSSRHQRERAICWQGTDFVSLEVSTSVGLKLQK